MRRRKIELHFIADIWADEKTALSKSALKGGLERLVDGLEISALRQVSNKKSAIVVEIQSNIRTMLHLQDIEPSSALPPAPEIVLSAAEKIQEKLHLMIEMMQDKAKKKAIVANLEQILNAMDCRAMAACEEYRAVLRENRHLKASLDTLAELNASSNQSLSPRKKGPQAGEPTSVHTSPRTVVTSRLSDPVEDLTFDCAFNKFPRAHRPSNEAEEQKHFLRIHKRMQDDPAAPTSSRQRRSTSCSMVLQATSDYGSERKSSLKSGENTTEPKTDQSSAHGQPYSIRKESKVSEGSHPELQVVFGDSLAGLQIQVEEKEAETRHSRPGLKEQDRVYAELEEIHKQTVAELKTLHESNNALQQKLQKAETEVGQLKANLCVAQEERAKFSCPFFS